LKAGWNTVYIKNVDSSTRNTETQTISPNNPSLKWALAVYENEGGGGYEGGYEYEEEDE
jgi:hypothetical protein